MNGPDWLNTHNVAVSCCLVRLRGWLKAEMPYSLGCTPAGRFPLRMALVATFRNDTIACHPWL